VWNIPGVVNGGGTTTYMAQVFAESELKKAANIKGQHREIHNI